MFPLPRYTEPYQSVRGYRTSSILWKSTTERFNGNLKYVYIWRLGPVTAIGSHMECKVANIDSDCTERIELSVVRVVAGREI